MGLDMYLEKRTYVKNWDHMKPEEKHKVTVTKNGKKTNIKTERVKNIVEEVGYWRKANQIHKWFVDNVFDGDDDQSEAYVSREQLQTLLDLVKKVLTASKLIDGKINNGYTWNPGEGRVDHVIDGKVIEDPTVAKELLPTQEGFFFGSTDYDEYYIEDLKNTEKILTECLEDEDDGNFYYSASW